MPSGNAVGVNENCTIIVGTVGTIFPYSIYWKEGSIPENMGYLRGGYLTEVSAVSGNGLTAVGTGNTTGDECLVKRAFRWSKDRRPQMEDLGVPDGYDESHATDLNDTGTVIVGHCHQVAGGVDAFCWDESSGTRRMIKLPAPQGALENSTRLCRANGSNKDGTLIVGDCKLENGSTQAVCWLGNTRTVITLPLLENGIRAQANAVSRLIISHDDVIVGGVHHQPIHNACGLLEASSRYPYIPYRKSQRFPRTSPRFLVFKCEWSKSRWDCYRGEVFIRRNTWDAKPL